jgi:hypothetical protein
LKESTKSAFPLGCHQHHHGQPPAKGLRGEHGDVALDHPLFAQALGAAQVGRRRQPDEGGQFFAGPAVVFLQGIQQAAVEIVELHDVLAMDFRICRPS